MVKVTIAGHIGPIPEEQREEYVEGEKQWMMEKCGMSEEAASDIARLRFDSHNLLELLDLSFIYRHP